MRKGAGAGQTRADHLAVAAQLTAALARARQVRDLADLIGTAALTETDRCYLALAEVFSSELVSQRVDETRSLDDTLARAWKVVSELPARELTMVTPDDLAAYYVGSIDNPAPADSSTRGSGDG
jgi:V/A-type H+-transporting ATPase subunit B